MEDLTGFKRDVLRGIAALTNENGQPPKGLAILEWLEDEAGYANVNHGRLYPTLDDLTYKGLVQKEQRDKRTNEYRLTPRGKRDIQAYLNEWLTAVDGLYGVQLADEAEGLDALFPENDDVAADGGK